MKKLWAIRKIDFGVSMRLVKIRNADKNSRIISFFSIFSETERRFRKQINSYKIKEVERDKLWLLARISPHLGVMRHI